MTNATKHLFTYVAYDGNPRPIIADLPALLAHDIWTQFKNNNCVGWETNSQIAYPQFANVPDFAPTDGAAYSNADYRLKSTSPARGAGVDLTSTGWPDSETADSTPDIGALPYGAPMIAVGIDGLKFFPDSTTPIAEAGDYSNVSDTNGDGFETLILDGTDSSDPNGSISSYAWVLNGLTTGTSSSFSKALPIGTQQVWLTVTDDSSNTAKDMREITVTDPAGLDNLVRNPGLESGTTSWSFISGGSVVTTPAHLGAKALNLAGTTTYSEVNQSGSPKAPRC